MSKVVYEGWMVRYGRRKIGRSYIHMRYFVLEPRLLAYYKKKPQDNQLPIKTMVIDGNCRVEDRGLKTHHGHMVYVLSVYNKKEKHHRITMAAFNIQEALMWKEKIECVIDQHQESLVPSGQQYVSFEYKPGMDVGRTASSSDHESPFSALEDEDDTQRDLMRRTTIGNGPPESILDWTKEFDAELSNQNSSNQAFSRKHWRLLQCQNGLRIFEELLEVDYLPRSCSRAMKAVGVVEATCEEIFELVMSMDGTRYEWDCSFQYGRLVEEVDGHTAILYHRLLLDWFPMVVWPRDLCYVRYWRRNDDGSYVVLFRSREHENCGPQPGFVRAHLESGGFNIAPLKPRNGRPRTQVQHLIQIDLKGWGAGYLPAFQQHCLLQMLNSVSGLREWFSQTDDRGQPIRIPVMVNMASSSLALGKGGKPQHKSSLSIDQTNGASRNSALMDEDSDDVDEFQLAESDHESPGDGRAIHRIVETTPKVHEYIPGERTENPRDKVTEFPTGKFGANHERPSSDAKTNDNFLDRPFTYSPKHNKVKPPNIQVFINFRGDQLRKYFISYLADALRKREINVFIDTKANIGDDLINLFKRIDDSGIAIVVFSSRYTESEWCLDELVRIKERAHQGLLKVLPIFYKVTPGNVKRLKGEFGDNFRDKEHTYASDESKIKQWKDAIVFVSHKFALTFDEKSSELEIDFIETIIKEVLKMLQYLVESGESSR